MKRIGLIGAMEEEVTLVKDSLLQVKKTEKAGLEFHEGIINHHQVIVVRSGIGKVNAAMCAQILIDEYKVEYLINIGVAGALSDDLEIGDIVLSTDLIEHDFDVRGFGYPKGEIPRMDTSVFKGDPLLLDMAKKSASALSGVKVREGRIATGDIFVNEKALREELNREFGASCAEMEGGAIAHVCHLNKIPVLVIRAMSDKANGEAMENFSEFEHMAAVNSKKLILEMLKNGI